MNLEKDLNELYEIQECESCPFAITKYASGLVVDNKCPYEAARGECPVDKYKYYLEKLKDAQEEIASCERVIDELINEGKEEL